MVDSTTINRLTAIVTPIVADLGLDLYDIEFVSGVVRVVVDVKSGAIDKPANVDLEAISVLTRLISREFDHNEPVNGRYTLEVTSPGLERSLRLPSHYISSVNKVINLRLVGPLAEGGERRIQGLLIAANDKEITMRNDKNIETQIKYSQIDRARTVFEWKTTTKDQARHQKKPAAKVSSEQSTNSINREAKAS